MDQFLLSYYIGIILVIINSIVLIFTTLNKNTIKFIGIINIVGFIMIAYYFMNKEKLY